MNFISKIIFVLPLVSFYIYLSFFFPQARPSACEWGLPPFHSSLCERDSLCRVFYFFSPYLLGQTHRSAPTFLLFAWAAKLADIKTLFYYCSIIHFSILAHFAFSHPRGINFVYASRDQWLQNSPITKPCFIIVQLSILRCCVSWARCLLLS